HTRSKRDWSSDVCSSDLVQHDRDPLTPGLIRARLVDELLPPRTALVVEVDVDDPLTDAVLWLRRICVVHTVAAHDRWTEFERLRSEERRVGRECRCVWWP